MNATPLYPWMLPEYLEDALPQTAKQIEYFRRQLLDLFAEHGYKLVIPPMIEYLESLTIGMGHDLFNETFKIVDQLSGHLVGLRADITPQIARIDAHLLKENRVNRLCYAGEVLRTKPNFATQSRQPFQIGAEIFGEPTLTADIEILGLLSLVLTTLGLKQTSISLNHANIISSLVNECTPTERNHLQTVLQQKDQTQLKGLIQDESKLTRFLDLLTLQGDRSILSHAKKKLGRCPIISQALDELTQVVEEIPPQINVHIDLADLRGYHYHTGVVFAVYSEGFSGTVAQGGRYDGLGEIFGRDRPATGFSLDLRYIVKNIIKN